MEGDEHHMQARLSLAPSESSEEAEERNKCEEEEGWAWLWGLTRLVMSRAMRIRGPMHEIVRNTWEHCKLLLPPEEIGEVIFHEIAREAPFVMHIFKRPQKIQAQQLVNAVEMLVLFTQDTARFFKDMQQLTVRHIKFGVKADYVKPFGRAILAALKKILGDEWDEPTRTAWEALYEGVSTFIARSLSSGASITNVALVQGDVDKFVDAVSCTPRGERSKALTEVEVHGKVVSPLYWAIRDGKFTIAKFIIDDLLAIRADREEYYYGREMLWESHPQLAHVLCQECPMLLEDVFDGLMWHSHTILDGQFRVNFYIKELYGDPDEVDPWDAPLSTLTLEGLPPMFTHPVVEKVIEVKWKQFVRNGFLVLQLYFTLVVILFTIGFVVHGNSCDTSWTYVRLLVGFMAVVFILVFSALIFSQWRCGQVGQAKILGRSYLFPRFLLNPSNVFRYASYLVLILVTLRDGCLWGESAHMSERRGLGCPGRGVAQDQVLVEVNFHVDVTWDMILTGFCTFALWIQQTQLLTLSVQLSAFTFTIFRMFTDVYYNLAIISIILVSFAATLTVMREDQYPTLEASIIALLRGLLGLQPPNSELMDPAGLFVLITFTVIIDIGFLNILIAQLALAYEGMKADTRGYANMNRAFNCVEIESFLPLRWRRKLWEEMDFDKPVEFDLGDEGPSGGLQVVVPASRREQVRYVPDRIQRYAGPASPMDPWPMDHEDVEE